MATVFKHVLPVNGKKVRNDAFPNRPIDEKIPTKVKWTTYWQRRLKDKEIEVVGSDIVAGQSNVDESTKEDVIATQVQEVTEEIVDESNQQETQEVTEVKSKKKKSK